MTKEDQIYIKVKNKVVLKLEHHCQQNNLTYKLIVIIFD